VTHWHSPYFFAYFPTASSYPAMLADMLCGAIGCIGFSWVSVPMVLGWEAVPVHMGQEKVAMLSMSSRATLQEEDIAPGRVPPGEERFRMECVCVCL
jgi:hypothetical protein